MTPPAPSDTYLAGHGLLLGMAGRIPDLTLARARRMLANGQAKPAIAVVAELLAATPIVLTAGELAAIRDLIGDSAALPDAKPAAGPPALYFRFGELGRHGEIERDEIDEALVAAAEAHGGGVAGIWRTWRYLAPEDSTAMRPLAGQESPDDTRGAVPSLTLAVDYAQNPLIPHRVYVVQVEDRGAIQRLAATLLGAVPDEADVGIEIIALGSEPPPYQRAALAESLLLWATVTGPEFTVAKVFDFADPITGPGFAPGHPVIDDPAERERLLAYLRAGHPVMMTTAGMEDILDPAAGPVVPASFRTDGEWIWTDTVGYYLSRHGIAPDAELMTHIKAQFARGVTAPDVDRDTAIRATDFLLHPPAAKATTAVWFPGTGGASA